MSAPARLKPQTKRNRQSQRPPTNAAYYLLPLTILTPLLASCEAERAPPVAAVRTVLAQNTPAARKAEIRRQLAAVCPTPLSDDELERAASYVEAHRDKRAVWIAGRLARVDQETRICRGLAH
jgi:hypothetical protein